MQGKERVIETDSLVDSLPYRKQNQNVGAERLGPLYVPARLSCVSGSPPNTRGLAVAALDPSLHGSSKGLSLISFFITYWLLRLIPVDLNIYIESIAIICILPVLNVPIG